MADATLTGTAAPPPASASPPALAEGSGPDAPTGAGIAGVPDSFDGYVLLKPIGRGAMGEVFLAKDTVLERAVAIKLIASLEPGLVARERFLREARAIARLQHPNVVAVYRAGEVGGLPYLVSELVRGGSLDRVDLPLEGATLLRASVGLASGLAAAHRRGVLHRDLKPANALLSDDGEVKLCDFGLAKLIGHDEAPHTAAPSATPGGTGVDLTRAGAWLGTPRYMAPEIWRAEPATMQSDLYSLGAMIYKLASGQSAIQGADIDAVRAAALAGATRPLAEVAPRVDRRLAALVDRCLAVAPEGRPRSADEVLTELMALTTPTSSVPSGNPYRGLRPFDIEHRGLFFGRRAESIAVLERLRTDALVVVAGDSGVGKSSLCRAGVLPLVADGSLQDERVWRAVRIMPGRHPLAEVARALAPHLERGDASIAETITNDPRSLVLQLRASLGDTRGLVLLIDQLEELVTESDERERDLVSVLIAELAQRIPGIRVLATARGDFLTRLAALPGLGPELSRGLHLLGPLDRGHLTEVIVGPARATGVAFESEAMVDQLVAAGGTTPLLQFALAELWERRDTARGVITAAALAAIGGVEGALARHADGVLAALTPPERQRARQILCQLVTIEGTRAHRAEAELVVDDAARAALVALVRGRLVAAHSDESGDSVYEVAHEALLSGWTTLRGWLDGDAHRRAVHERLAAASAEWDRLSGVRSVLWADAHLAEAARVDLVPEALAGRERAFLAASMGEQRRRRWRNRGLIVAAPLVVAALWAGIALKARLDRDHAVAAQLNLAQPQLAGAGAYASAALAFRSAAFAAFDSGKTADGEKLWADALRMYESTRKTYAGAMRALETGRELEGRNGNAAELSRATLYARAVLAEVFYKKDEVAELREQLGWLDPTKRWAAKWDAPATLTVTSDPAGATLTIAQYESQPDGHRVLGPVRSLGKAPVTLQLAPGSYRLMAEVDGRTPTLYPLRVERGRSYEMFVPVISKVPEGYRFVPPGAFLYGSSETEVERANVMAEPLRSQWTDGFLIGKYEVTWEDWLQFLITLSPMERENRRTHLDKLELTSVGKNFELRLDPSGVEYRATTGQPIVYQHRQSRSVQRWERFPAAGMTISDGRAFIKWLDTSHRMPEARFCTDREWERAARGADERKFPTGDTLAADDANFDITYGRDSSAFGPDEVGSHILSDSPFAVSDLAGNIWEFVDSSMPTGEVFIRGGGFYENISIQDSTNRMVTEPAMRDHVVGLRVCAPWKGNDP